MANRREFLKGGCAAGMIGLGLFGGSERGRTLRGAEKNAKTPLSIPHPIRVGGPVFDAGEDYREWAAAARRLGYRAVYAPDVALNDREGIDTVKAACAENDLVIAEVGRWNNLMDRRADEAKKNLDSVIEGLMLAEELNARCCVNIPGTFAEDPWYGPDPKNFSDEFFDLAVENARKIIDAVGPKRTKFAYEITGWGIPNDPESYLRLIRAIDREGFGVHLDVCNMVNSPTRFWGTTAFINEAFDKLGDKIVSCHAKDLRWEVEMNIHFVECVVGEGKVDIAALLKRLANLPADVPLMIEHMKNEEEYSRSRENIFRIAAENGLSADGRSFDSGKTPF